MKQRATPARAPIPAQPVLRVDSSPPALAAAAPMPTGLTDDPQYAERQAEVERLERELAGVDKQIAEAKAAQARNRQRGLLPGAELVKGAGTPEPVADLTELQTKRNTLANAVRVASNLRNEILPFAERRLQERCEPHLLALIAPALEHAKALAQAVLAYRETAERIRFNVDPVPIGGALWAENGDLNRLIRDLEARANVPA